MKKIFAMLLALAMVFALAACGGNNAADDKPVKIGVLVADVSGEEALGFRAYYENYIAKNYNVIFTYTEQLADAAAEKSAIEKFAAQGYDAILSLSSADRATQIETAAANKLYYAVVSGMLDDAQFEQYKNRNSATIPNIDREYIDVSPLLHICMDSKTLVKNAHPTAQVTICRYSAVPFLKNLKSPQANATAVIAVSTSSSISSGVMMLPHFSIYTSKYPSAVTPIWRRASSFLHD